MRGEQGLTLGAVAGPPPPGDATGMNSPVTFLYIDPPDVPEGMTIADYRRARTASAPRRWRLRRPQIIGGRMRQQAAA